MSHISKKIAVITGAAKGIGMAIAIRMANDGCYVVITDIDEENSRNLVQKIGPNNSQFIYCDISSEKEVKNLFKTIIAEHQKVDILINNAGIIHDNMIWNMPVEDFELVINVNLKGTWLMCKETAIIMRKQNYGRIINISSRSWLGNAGQSNYSASKAGIVSLSRVLALELGKYNISVNAVAPGLIDTPLTQRLKPEILQKLLDAQPSKEMGHPDDVANTVAFLAAENTNFITGQVIHVDGGKSIGTV